MNTPTQATFDLALNHAIQESLSSISPSVPSMVLFYLKKNMSNGSSPSINDPQALDECLMEIFGFGAKVIEKKILEILNARLFSPTDIEDSFNFVEEVENTLERFCAQSAGAPHLPSINLKASS